MASIPTKIKLKDFFNAIQLIAVSKGMVAKPYKGSQGSQYCFEFFQPDALVPLKVICYHEDLKSGVIYTGDLKKYADFFGMKKSEFEEFVKKNL